MEMEMSPKEKTLAENVRMDASNGEGVTFKMPTPFLSRFIYLDYFEK